MGDRAADAALLREAIREYRRLVSQNYGSGDVEYDYERDPDLREQDSLEDAALARLEVCP